MEFVLVRLEIAKLGEVLVAVVELAREGLRLGVHDLVRPHVAVLGERLPADVTMIWPLARVPSFVRLEVAELAEALAAGGLFTHERFDTGVGPGVNLQVRLLIERLPTARDVAMVAFPRIAGAPCLLPDRLLLLSGLGRLCLGLNCAHENVDVGAKHGLLRLIRRFLAVSNFGRQGEGVDIVEKLRRVHRRVFFRLDERLALVAAAGIAPGKR